MKIIYTNYLGKQKKITKKELKKIINKHIDDTLEEGKTNITIYQDDVICFI